MDGHEQEVARAVKEARSELARMRAVVGRVRQLVLDYDPGDGLDRWDEVRIEADRGLREVETFFGGETS